MRPFALGLVLCLAACSSSSAGGGGDPIDAKAPDGDGVLLDVADQDGAGDGAGDTGGVGQPCHDEQTCDEGAMCVNGWCVPDTPLDAGPDGAPDATPDITPDTPPQPDVGPPDAVNPPCTGDSDCPDDLPQCLPQGVCAFCYPGLYACQDGKSMWCVEPYGDAWELSEDCAAKGLVCLEAVGVCLPEGEVVGKLADTNAGYEFWAVDLQNATASTPAKFLDAQSAPFAVIVSNTSATETATVSLTYPGWLEQTADVDAQGLHVFQVPSTWGLEGTGITLSAFRVQSSQPIVAHQFNPLHNVDVFSNDASLLLPSALLGSEHYIVTLEHFMTDYEGTFTVVGVQEDPVDVTVKVTADTLAGGDLPALNAGSSFSFTIVQGEVANFLAESGDLTGTHVVAGGPIAVFGGHIAARPEKGDCCSDHLEQQMPPVTTWGKDFFVGRSMERGNEVDYFRVVASQDDTVVTTPVGAWVLGAGEWQEFTSDTHLQVTADKPVMVAQFLASAMEASMLNTLCDSDADCGPAYTCDPFACQEKEGCTSDEECGPMHTCNEDLYQGGFNCKAIGDPAMTLAVPLAQWQTDFVFLTPNTYYLDFVNVVAPVAAQITLDGGLLPAASFEAISGTDYGVYRVEVADGVHTMSATTPVSLTVYGYDAAVSYAYPGAMGLKTAP